MKTLHPRTGAKAALALALASAIGLSSAAVDMQRVSNDAWVKAPETVDCTLENGLLPDAPSW